MELKTELAQGEKMEMKSYTLDCDLNYWQTFKRGLQFMSYLLHWLGTMQFLSHWGRQLG